MLKPVYYLVWQESDNVTQKSFLEVNYKPLFLGIKESAINKIADHINM